MSFLAKLFINDEVRNILNAKQVFSRLADVNGKPTTKPLGKQLEFSLESTKDDSFLYHNMFSPTSSIKGEIVFYKRDGLSTLFKIEFANAYVLRLSEHFDASGASPMHMNISIGWGIIKMRGLLHEETWNPNNPFVNIDETKREEKEKKVTSYTITNTDGQELESYKIGDIIVLNIETSNRVGDAMTISLDDKSHDFKYNGQVLHNDTIKDYIISSDSEKIQLEVIQQSTQN